MFYVHKYMNKKQRDTYYAKRSLSRAQTHDPATGKRVDPLPRYIGKVRFRLSDLA